MSAASDRGSTTGGAVRNVLFIMCDQLRADYLSCYGGPVATPNIDRLASRGLRFERAYVTSGVCGPSRVSSYTGRYPVSHRVTWNRVPMPVDELTLGHYLHAAGRRMDLLGKTHFVPDRAAVAAHGYAMDAEHRRLFEEGGFNPVERYDGHFEPEADSPYRRYLLERGYRSEQPWTDFVIGSRGADGDIASGWLLRNAALPAQVHAEDSETAYLTTRAIAYIDGQGDAPWALHLSYIKPHWPTKAPAPYHALYTAEDAPAPHRSQAERERPHPVFGAYQKLEESESFARDEVWRTIRPIYMGLVKQLDDELGRLFAHLEQRGRMDDTLVIFTSDHGDLAGDHWLGEKEYFYEPVMRVPLIVRDPSSAADATRGQATPAFAECIDIVPTVLEALGLDLQTHRVEGRSLLGLARGAVPADWRDCVYGQLDYSYRQARHFLERGPADCMGYMLREDRYKYIYWQGYAEQLFDLQADPHELEDRGEDPGLAAVRLALRDRLFQWLAARKHRATETLRQVEARTHAHERLMGIQIGKW